MSNERPQMYEAESVQAEELSKEKQVESYIRTFEYPADNLLEQLHENIKAGMYVCVLGIDASGRIPALILGDSITELSRENGTEPPTRLFVTPQYSESSTPQLQQLFAHADEIRASGKKVLIVDDTLFKGNALINATTELRDHNIAFDIGIFLTVNVDEEGVERFRTFLEADHIYVGDSGYFADETEDTPRPIVKKKELSGVRKPETYPSPGYSEKNVTDQELIKLSRQEVKKLVQDLVSRRSQVNDRDKG